MNVEGRCSPCEKTFSTTRDFREHSWGLSHHIRLTQRKANAWHQCDLCDFSCDNLADYSKHVDAQIHCERLRSWQALPSTSAKAPDQHPVQPPLFNPWSGRFPNPPNPPRGPFYPPFRGLGPWQDFSRPPPPIRMYRPNFGGGAPYRRPQHGLLGHRPATPFQKKEHKLVSHKTTNASVEDKHKSASKKKHEKPAVKNIVENNGKKTKGPERKRKWLERKKMEKMKKQLPKLNVDALKNKSTKRSASTETPSTSSPLLTAVKKVEADSTTSAVKSPQRIMPELDKKTKFERMLRKFGGPAKKTSDIMMKERHQKYRLKPSQTTSSNATQKDSALPACVLSSPPSTANVEPEFLSSTPKVPAKKRKVILEEVESAIVQTSPTLPTSPSIEIQLSGTANNATFSLTAVPIASIAVSSQEKSSDIGVKQSSVDVNRIKQESPENEFQNEPLSHSAGPIGVPAEMLFGDGTTEDQSPDDKVGKMLQLQTLWELCQKEETLSKEMTNVEAELTNLQQMTTMCMRRKVQWAEIYEKMYKEETKAKEWLMKHKMKRATKKVRKWLQRHQTKREEETSKNLARMLSLHGQSLKRYIQRSQSKGGRRATVSCISPNPRIVVTRSSRDDETMMDRVEQVRLFTAKSSESDIFHHASTSTTPLQDRERLLSVTSAVSNNTSIGADSLSLRFDFNLTSPENSDESNSCGEESFV